VNKKGNLCLVESEHPLKAESKESSSWKTLRIQILRKPATVHHQFPESMKNHPGKPSPLIREDHHCKIKKSVPIDDLFTLTPKRV
jgi:hypothetical protein